jgi:hypothetical protein
MVSFYGALMVFMIHSVLITLGLRNIHGVEPGTCNCNDRKLQERFVVATVYELPGSKKWPAKIKFGISVK